MPLFQPTGSVPVRKPNLGLFAAFQPKIKWRFFHDFKLKLWLHQWACHILQVGEKWWRKPFVFHLIGLPCLVTTSWSMFVFWIKTNICDDNRTKACRESVASYFRYTTLWPGNLLTSSSCPFPSCLSTHATCRQVWLLITTRKHARHVVLWWSAVIQLHLYLSVQGARYFIRHVTKNMDSMVWCFGYHPHRLMIETQKYLF